MIAKRKIPSLPLQRSCSIRNLLARNVCSNSPQYKFKLFRLTVLPRSPPWSAWNVTQSKYNEAVAQAKRFGFAGDVRIEFLCAKGVEPLPKLFSPNGLPVTRFDLITNPPDKDWEQNRDVLHGILGMKTRNKTIARDEKEIPRKISFAAFCKKHPEWADRNSSFVFFRDHSAFRALQPNKALIQREQIFGTCAIHAPIVMQHYLVATANRGVAPTVDIPKWLRRHASKTVLDGVVYGKGSHADQILEYILLPTADIRKVTLFADVERVLSCHGPVLLPMWGVASDFFSNSQWSHTGRSTEKVKDHHSMLVVGHRVTTAGDSRLLLQNWWRGKQFVEVDRAYYNSCMKARAMYVHCDTPQLKIPARLDTTNALFSVSMVDGAGVSGVGAGPAG